MTIDYFENIFPEYWDLKIRSKIEAVNSAEPSKVISAHTMYRELINWMLVAKAADVSEQVQKIIKWFDDKPNLERNIKNDLFFGCGFMLYISQYKSFSLYFDYIRQNTDFDFNRKVYQRLKRLEELLSNKTDKLHQELFIEIKKLTSCFYKESLLAGYEIKSYNLRKTIGQNVENSGNIRIKYPKSTLKIASLLVFRLADSDLCQSNTRYKETIRKSTNIKLACKYLNELASLFGVILPQDLRKRISLK